MTTPQAVRFRERWIIRLLVIALLTLLGAILGQGVLNQRIQEQQDDLRSVQCAAAETFMAAPRIRNPDTQTVLQWARSVDARLRLLRAVTDVGCDGEDFEARRLEAVRVFQAILDKLYAQNPGLAGAVAGQKGVVAQTPSSGSQRPSPSPGAGGGTGSNGGGSQPEQVPPSPPSTPSPSVNVKTPEAPTVCVGGLLGVNCP